MVEYKGYTCYYSDTSVLITFAGDRIAICKDLDAAMDLIDNIEAFEDID